MTCAHHEQTTGMNRGRESEPARDPPSFARDILYQLHQLYCPEDLANGFYLTLKPQTRPPTQHELSISPSEAGYSALATLIRCSRIGIKD